MQGRWLTVYWAILTLLIRKYLQNITGKYLQKTRSVGEKRKVEVVGILDWYICCVQDVLLKETMLTEMSAVPCVLPGYLSWILPRRTFHPASLGSSVGLLAVIKTQNPSCLQIRVLDLSSPNPTSNMHLSPGQLAQITTALPEKGPFGPQGIGRRGWIIPSIQRPRGSFFFSKCFQFPLGELLLGIFFPSVFPWMWLRLWSRKWGGGGTSEKCIAPFQNSSGIN